MDRMLQWFDIKHAAWRIQGKAINTLLDNAMNYRDDIQSADAVLPEIVEDEAQGLLESLDEGQYEEIVRDLGVDEALDFLVGRLYDRINEEYIETEARELFEDAMAQRRDPLGYVGMKQSDFL